MTREEAQDEIRRAIDGWKIKQRELRQIINEIYDSFESRTCENCKYSTNDNWVCDAGIGRPSKDFGCLNFDIKD